MAKVKIMMDEESRQQHLVIMISIPELLGMLKHHLGFKVSSLGPTIEQVIKNISGFMREEEDD